MIRSSILVVLLASFALSACVSTGGAFAPSNSKARKDMVDAIAQEPKGYYVGRRYYKVDYKFWGYVRKSGEPWSTARLIMMNENSKLAPDREGGTLGSDNNYEYKLFGDFDGDTVYEPASNRFYPEFKLKGTQLLTTTPGPIYHDPKATNPEWRVIPTPY